MIWCPLMQYDQGHKKKQEIGVEKLFFTRGFRLPDVKIRRLHDVYQRMSVWKKLKNICLLGDFTARNM